MNQLFIGLSRVILCGVWLLCLQATNANAQKSKSKSKSAPSETQMQTPVYAISKERIEAVLDEAYNKYKDIKEGKNADYIKELAQVDPNIFGIAVVKADGQVFTKGDIQSMVSIQSVSKVFTMAQVIEEQGPKAVMDKIGVDATGMRFNSIVAVEMQKGKEINPLVNPGAIAATSMVKGVDSTAKWKNVVRVMSDFAGRPLYLNMPVYISEAGDNM